MRNLILSLSLVLAWGTSLSCAGRIPYIWYSELPAAEQQEQFRDVISPGDRILVQVTNHPELSGEFVVGASGAYSQPLVGLVTVGGSDPGTASTQIAKELSRFVQTPAVGVTVVTRGPIRVTVIGEVANAGSFEIPYGSNMLAALGRAGGLSAFAGPDEIYLLRAAPTARRIRFRYLDLTRPDAAAISFRLRDGDTILVE